MKPKGRLRFCVVAGGTRGDVEPLTEVIRGVAAEGHDVRFVANGIYRDSIEACGATWVDDESQDPRQVMAAEAAESGQWTRPPGRLKRLIFAWKNMGPRAHHLRVQAEQVREADIVVYNLMASPAYIAAQAAGRPAICLSVTTCIPSRCHSKPMGPIWQHRRRMPGLYNLAVPWAFSFYLWSADRNWLRPWCRELGVPVPGLREWVMQSKAWQYFGFSARLLPQPTDWPSMCEVTGFWFSEETCRFAAAALHRPIPRSPRNAYLYFGSNAVGEDPVVRDVMIPVLGELGLQTVDAASLKGQGGARRDYREILGESDIVIHHGGVGTSGLVAQFGCASVIVPAFGEQRFWAARMEKVGLCPRVIPRLELDRAGFKASVEAVLRDPGYLERARAFGRGLLTEKGTEKTQQRILEIAAAAVRR